MKARIKQALKNNKGFTMIELMVVIVIILILAAIAIPSFSRLVGEAKEAAATAEARTVLMLAQMEVDKAIIDGQDPETVLESQKEEIQKDAGLANKKDIKITYTVDADNAVTVVYEYTTDKTVTLPEPVK